MANSDPRRFSQSPDDLERRFEELYRRVGPLASPRPTDLPSALAMLQELWDRLNPRGK